MSWKSAPIREPPIKGLSNNKLSILVVVAGGDARRQARRGAVHCKRLATQQRAGHGQTKWIIYCSRVPKLLRGPKMSFRYSMPLQGAFVFAHANRFAGGKHASRNPCYAYSYISVPHLIFGPLATLNQMFPRKFLSDPPHSPTLPRRRSACICMLPLLVSMRQFFKNVSTFVGWVERQRYLSYRFKLHVYL
jgi:hypothetical protein